MMLSIPLLAFAGNWQAAAVLLVIERAGKALRTPARDAILSHAAKAVGRGTGFGLHEALDQIGAFIGPLLFTVVFLLKGSYREGFILLGAPALLSLIFLFRARRKAPSPERFEAFKPVAGKGLPRAFYLYTLFTFLTAAGFANFQLISYHFKVQAVVPDIQIPVFYAMAMAVDAAVAIPIGKAYDRRGPSLLAISPLLAMPLPFLAFSGNYGLVLAGIALWGVIMGVHETIIRAAIADLVPPGRRGVAYGAFNTAYGLAWLMGGWLMGLLYDVSLNYVFLMVAGLQTASLVVFFFVRKGLLRGGS